MPPSRGNPFWSERACDELTLRATRPAELPAVPTDDELKESSGQRAVQQDQSRGREVSRLERSEVRSLEKEDEGIMGERFATPLVAPSSWIKTDSDGMRQGGTKTEGPLPNYVCGGR